MSPAEALQHAEMHYLQNMTQRASTSLSDIPGGVLLECDLTKEIIVEVFAVGVGHASSGVAFVFFCHLTPIWVDARQDNNSGLIDQLNRGRERPYKDQRNVKL